MTPAPPQLLPQPPNPLATSEVAITETGHYDEYKNNFASLLQNTSHGIESTARETRTTSGYGMILALLLNQNQPPPPPPIVNVDLNVPPVIPLENPPPPPPPELVINEVRVRDFQKLKPLNFHGGIDPAKANEWLESIEKIFQVMTCTDRKKVALAAYNLIVFFNGPSLLKKGVGTLDAGDSALLQTQFRRSSVTIDGALKLGHLSSELLEGKLAGGGDSRRKMRQGGNFAVRLDLFFGFQNDNVRNQHEHLILHLANALDAPLPNNFDSSTPPSSTTSCFFTSSFDTILRRSPYFPVSFYSPAAPHGDGVGKSLASITGGCCRRWRRKIARISIDDCEKET
ncbi:hypothetical protein RHSIM_Rhsim13G0139600 [Rhododendron simsii]|uniref:Gag-protease polyprotein n=1 Tax=Rhododendron simsii TaxID=118357 RepID=A0A834FZC7_RHOSS|nr:hypothetical protein RHSIM_Rhsim13G0139600 [Rhododendron simsii]